MLFRKQKDKIREALALRSKNITIKKRRQSLKKMRSSNNNACEKKEGVSYESGFALNDVSSMIVHPVVAEHEEVDLNTCKVLLYDLETTGTSRNDDIVQVRYNLVTVNYTKT